MDLTAKMDMSQDGVVCTLQKATKGDGVNFVIIGDGFIDDDMVVGGYFEKLAREACETLFSIEPTRSFREYFNVFAVKAISRDSGCGTGKCTAFSTRLKRECLDGDLDKCMLYAMKAPHDSEQIVVINIVNGADSGACCHTHPKGRIAFFSTKELQQERKGMFLHEAVGHGLGMLEDEYSTHDKRITKRAIEEWEVTGHNVDFTSDPAKIYWSDFLEREEYRDSVGIFEGGLYYAKGVWRSSETSLMRESTVLEFNAPSRYQIVMTTMKRAGVEFSFEDFLEYDKINL